MKLKVTDGDFILIEHPQEITQESRSHIAKAIHSWLKSKGLNNVEAMMVSSDVGGFRFTTLTVNDVFENEIIKGDKNG